MCLNESMAMTGRSSSDLPKWCSGCANRLPSAVRKLTFSAWNKQIHMLIDIGDQIKCRANVRFSSINCCSMIAL